MDRVLSHSLDQGYLVLLSFTMFGCLDVCLDVCFFFSPPTHSALGILTTDLCNPESRNSVQGCIWIVSGSNLKVIGQRSESQGQKKLIFLDFCERFEVNPVLWPMEFKGHWGQCHGIKVKGQLGHIRSSATRTFKQGQFISTMSCQSCSVSMYSINDLLVKQKLLTSERLCQLGYFAIQLENCIDHLMMQITYFFHVHP